MDDFFSKIDSKLEEQKQRKESANTQKEENRAFLAKVCTEVAPIVAKYEHELQARNINVSSTIRDHLVSVELKFADGGHNRLTLSQDIDSGRLTMEKHFTNDDGKNYKSTDGRTFNEQNWRNDLFETALKKLIEDFVFYAPRHGGI